MTLLSSNILLQSPRLAQTKSVLAVKRGRCVAEGQRGFGERPLNYAVLEDVPDYSLPKTEIKKSLAAN